MDQKQFRRFTKEFARDGVLFAEALPTSRTGNSFAGQLIRCAGSVGANYRAACRAKSRPDMKAKFGIVLEEADECQFWLEMCVECAVSTADEIRDLHYRANQIVAMCVASIQTLSRKSSEVNRGIEESPIE